jgi:hypothetical protein
MAVICSMSTICFENEVKSQKFDRDGSQEPYLSGNVPEKLQASWACATKKTYRKQVGRNQQVPAEILMTACH